MAKNKRNSFSTNYILQTGGLTAPLLVFQLIGLIYFIPLTNIIGAAGMGYYATAGSLLLLIYLIVGYSLSLALSRLVYDKSKRKEYMGANQLFQIAMLAVVAIGGALAIIFYFAGDHVVGALFYRSTAHYALKPMLLAFILMMISGILIGYFSGLGNSAILTIYLFFYQIFNIPAGLFFAYRQHKSGIQAGLVFKNEELAGGMGASGASWGLIAGAAAGFLFVAFLYGISRSTLVRRISKGRNEMYSAPGYLLTTLVKTAGTVLTSCSLYYFLLITDNIVFSRIMRSISGASLEITRLWGEYAGKYLVLTGIPVFFALWMASRSLSRLGRAYENEDRGQMLSGARSAIHVVMVFSIPAALFLTLFAGPMVNLLFSGDNQIAGKMVLTGSSRVLLMALAMVEAGILKQLGRKHEMLLNTAISFIAYLLTVILLLLVGKLSIHSLVFGNLVFFAAVSILHMRTIIGRLHYRLEAARTFFFPFLASGFMGGIAVLIYMLLMNLLDNNIVATMAALLAGMITYTIIILKSGSLDEFDLRLLPGGSKVCEFYKRIRLL